MVAALLLIDVKSVASAVRGGGFARVTTTREVLRG